MKQRDPLTATLLSLFVPFYVFYWFYVTAEDLAKRGAKKPNFALLYGPFVGLVTLIPFIILSGRDGETNVFNVLALLVGVVSVLAMIVCPLVYYYKFSEGVEHVTNKSLTKGLLFVLFWFVSPAGVYLTQDKLNTLGADAATGTPSQPPVNPVPPANPA